MAGPVDPIFSFSVSQLKGMGGRLTDIGNKIENLSKASEDWLNKLNASTSKASGGINDLGNQIDKTTKKFRGSEGSVKDFGKSIDKVAKGLIGLQSAIVGLGFKYIISGIERVYELKERWAKATGELNKRMGALTPNLRTLTKEANSWRGTLRGMTGDFELGASMFADLAETLETTTGHVKEFSKLNLVLARGFNLGGRGAGEMTKAFRSMGMDSKESTMTIAGLTRESEILGVNSQVLVKELSEAGDMMARFGKAGVKSFIQSAVYLKQFNIGIKDTRSLMDTFDKFDSATEATARLNTIFGTTISSMDMLLSTDPAERIEKVRQGLLAQGKTYEKLTYFERRSLSETLGIGEKEVAFLLDQKKAHVSLADFRAKAAKTKESEAKADARMRMQLRKTTQTLFDFGHAMDKITRAIGRALEPLLVALGLGTKQGGKFAVTMESITNEIVKWIDSLAKSKEWQKLMQNIADTLKHAAKWIASIKASDITAFFDKAVVYIQKFIKYSAMAIGAWTAGKVLGMIGNLTKIGDKIGSIVPGVGGMAARGIIRGGIGGAVGAGIGSITGGGTTGGSVGGAIGGALGSIAGPLGMAIGGAVGGWLGKHAEKFFTKKSAHEKKLDELLKERTKLVEKLSASEKARAIFVEKSRFKEEIEANRRKKFEDEYSQKAKEAGKKKVEISNKEALAISNQIVQFNNLGISNKKLEQITAKLSSPDGPVSITGDEFNAIAAASKQYGSKVEILRNQTDQLIAEQMKRIQVEGIGAKMREQDIKKQTLELELEQAKATEKANRNLLDDSQKRQLDWLSSIEAGTNAIEKRKLTANEKNQLEALRRNRKFLDETKSNRKRLETELSNAQKRELQLKLEHSHQMFAIERANAIMRSEPFLQMMEKQKAQNPEFTSKEGLTEFIMSGQAGRLDQNELKGMIDSGMIEKRMAAGGIVTRPTTALIGESGPEAVIPLRALATGNARQPASFGGAATKKLVNYAARGAAANQSQTIHVVAGDVYLDGAKVGRTIVRDALANGSV